MNKSAFGNLSFVISICLKFKFFLLNFFLLFKTHSFTISAPTYLGRSCLKRTFIQLQSPHGASKIVLILYFFIIF